MSVVERAIKKIQSRVSSGGKAPTETPIARTVVGKTIKGLSEGESADSGGFLGVAGRSIDFDFQALAAAGLLAPGNERLSDEYRAIKRPILSKASGSSASENSAFDSLVLVASALPGEGKTFTSVNLSLSLAQERDWSVLLVDTDCRNPSLSRLLGVSDQPGLLDYLRSSSADLGSFVLPTNIDRLYILPLGSADPQAAELLASERMKLACASLSAGDFGRFVAVFDSSPLLLTPEPVAISANVGQIVLAVRANHTPRSAVADAIGKLDPLKTIGLVLNRASSEDRITSYSYGYSYGSYGEQ